LRPGVWTSFYGGFKVLAFPTVHDAAEPMGFIIAKDGERILFATDTAELNYEFKNLTEIYVEANYSEQALVESSLDLSARIRIARSHMSLETLLAFLARQDLRFVRRIVLLHLSDGHSDENLFRTSIEAATGRPVSIAPKKGG
jgi:phosphoribosyl 1,2-cyclic phosphodiesterase